MDTIRYLPMPIVTGGHETMHGICNDYLNILWQRYIYSYNRPFTINYGLVWEVTLHGFCLILTLYFRFLQHMYVSIDLAKNNIDKVTHLNHKFEKIFIKNFNLIVNLSQ